MVMQFIIQRFEISSPKRSHVYKVRQRRAVCEKVLSGLSHYNLTERNDLNHSGEKVPGMTN